MATSARAAQLLEQRKASRGLYSSSGAIRLLSPTNTSVSSIAKSTVTSQLNVMVSNYNAGTVSNQDMLDFLTKIQDNPSLSASDKLDVSSQIRDFNTRIQSDKLTSVYKAAPDNSTAQLSAAQSLSAFYKSQASGMQPDTPAYATAMDNASQYDQRVATITDNIQKVNRQNQRYIAEQKINQLGSGTSDKASAKADMWKQLYDQAIADGDTTAANSYAASYQQEITNAQSLADKETATANKKTLSDYINTTINDYHDGKISGDEALTQLEQADQFAYSVGDTAAQNRLNSLSLTINREIDKGITYTSVNGLSQKSSGGGSSEPMLNPDGTITYGYTGGSGGTTKSSGGEKTGGTTLYTGDPISGVGLDKPKTFAELDFEYKSDLTSANQYLLAEKAPDGSPFTVDDYKATLEALAKRRQLQLQTITDWATGVEDANGADSKVGKAAIAVIDKYHNELNQVTANYNGIISGGLVLQMTNSGGVPTVGWTTKDKVANMIDSGGIYHPTYTQPYVIGDENAKNDFVNRITEEMKARGAVFDPASVKQDPNTGQYYFNQQVSDVYDTSGRKITYENNPKYGWIPVAAGPITSKLRDSIIAEADRAAETGHTYTPKILNYNDVVNYDYTNKPSIGNTATKITKPDLSQQVSNVAKTAGQIINPDVSNAAPVTPVAPIRQVPVTPLGPSGQQAISTAAAPIQTSSSTPKLTINPAAPSTPLKLATQTPSPVAQMNAGQPLKNIGTSPVKNTPVIQQPKPNALVNLGTTIGKTIDTGISNLKKLLGLK